MNNEPEIFRASLRRDGASIESLPQNSATNSRNRMVKEFSKSIRQDARRIFAGGQDPRRHCERIMKGGYQVVKNSKGKSDFVFPEKIYAVEGENRHEGIVERIFTKKKRYNSIPEKLNDETLAKINKETGHNLTRFELLLLAGYVFVESDGDINIDSITGCVPAICYIDPDYDFQNGSLIQNYRFTDSDGKELDKEEIKKLVQLVMSEIERTETVNENISEQENQEEQR